MSVEPGVLRSVSWRDCCPWLILFRTLRLAIGVQVLLLASLGAVANTAGWRVAEYLFDPQGGGDVDIRLQADVDFFRQWPFERRGELFPPIATRNRFAGTWHQTAPAEPMMSVVYRFVRPVWQLFDVSASYRVLAFYLFGFLWTLTVWALLGSVIARIASVYLGREERIGFGPAFRHALRKWGQHVAAPVLPLLGVLVLAIPMVVLGWCMRVNLGVLLAGLVWFLVLLGVVLMVILLLGLLFGWPLMWPTIQTEGSDAFDAISRAYAYTFQRPLQYLFYAVVAAALGLVGWLLVWGTSEAVVALGYWGTSWGAGQSLTVAVKEDANWDLLGQGDPTADQGAPLALAARRNTFLWRVGVTLIGFAVAFVHTLASAYAYSYFWCATSAIYLLLRSDADNTELDDICMEDEGETTYGLPPLSQDDAGVPRVDEQSDGARPGADQGEPGSGP
jgi:hypothetical protein